MKMMQMRWKAVPTLILFLSGLGPIFLGLAEAEAAITVGNVTTASADAASVTFSHNHNQGTNGLLVVSVTTLGTGYTVTNVTYGGIGLTFLGQVVHGSDKPRVSVWYRVNPPTGAANVVVTLPNNTKFGAAAISYGGVDQTTPLSGFATATGLSSTPSVNVTSATGDLVQDALGHLSNTPLTPGGGQAERWDFSARGDGRHGGSTEAGAASVTMSWTSGGSKEWALAGFNIKMPPCPAVADPAYVAANAQSGQAILYWSSTNPVLILRKIGSAISDAPSKGTSYNVNDPIGSSTVVYNGSVVETSFTQASLSNATTYYYKVFSRNDTCYSSGIQVNARPEAGPDPAWSYMMANGSTMRAGIAGTGSINSSGNFGRIISLNTANGTQSWEPAATSGAVQGWLTWLPTGGGGGAVIAGDQSARVYSVNLASGALNWQVGPLTGADAIQGPVAAQVRDWSDAAFQAAYTGDVLFVASRNASSTNNKVFALRASDGQVLWTFNGSSTYAVDYIVGMPWVDYARNRLYVTSRAGAAGTQASLWVLNSLDGALVNSFGLGHLEASPTMSYDGTSLYVGATNGDLYAYALTTLTQKWVTALPAGIKGFVWEDWTTPGRLYLSTTGGQVRCLQDNGGSQSPVWTTAVLSPSSPLPVADKLYMGSSDGKVHQLRLSDGVDEKQFTVGSGSFTVGDVSTETGNELFVPTTEGKLYKLPLPLP